MQITDYIEGFSVTNIPKCMHLLPTGELVLKGVQIGDVRFTDEVEKYGLLISFLSEEEKRIVCLLQQHSEGIQINLLVVEANIPINQMSALLFELEMKGVVRALAGGVYKLI